jgi:putative oxidoreductase
MSTAAAVSDPSARSSRGLHYALWVVQVLLALTFLMAGANKLVQPMATLATMMPWSAAVGEPLTRFIGACELLGGLGLILPAATRIKPYLTALAGLGLATVMTLAALFHVTRAEFAALPINATLGALAAFVAWGRYKKAPIAPR